MIAAPVTAAGDAVLQRASVSPKRGFVDSADGTRFSFLANGGVSTHAVNDEAGFADALLKVVPASDDAVVGPVAGPRRDYRSRQTRAETRGRPGK